MWSKKNKEKDEKTVVMRTSEIRQVSHTTTVRTIEQRSQSVSYSNNFSTSSSITPITSSQQPMIEKSNFLALPSSDSRFRSLSISSPKPSYSTDARPIINLNYQSPYKQNSPVYRQGTPTSSATNLYQNSLQRNTPAYSSYREPVKSPTNMHPPLKTIVQPIPPSDKKLVVKKTGKFYDHQTPIPTYKTTSKNRGEVLIINNIMFGEKGYRHGAKKDDENLKTVFKQMGFKVTVERDLKTSKMQSTLESFSRKSSLKNVDIAVIVIMSHGTRNETIGGTEVFGLDEKGIHVDELMDNFNEEKCKNLKDKPKIFIFQCCRGDNEQFIRTDSTRVSPVKPVLANALIAYSTLPGFVSHRSPEFGTWFIHTLCEVFCEHAHEYHVEDLLKMVDVKMSAYANKVRQTTHYENRGFKRCYLHPV